MRFRSNYDPLPRIHVETDEKAYAVSGWNRIAGEIRAAAGRRGGGAVVNQTGGPMKMAEAGGGQNTSNAVVEQARSTLGMPTGAELPT